MTEYEAPYYTQTQLNEMDDDDIHYPYSDDYMYYNGKTHQYEIKLKAFQEIDPNFNNDPEFKSASALNTFFKGVSRKFYKVAFHYGRQNPINTLEYIVARRGLKVLPPKQYRQYVIQALVDLGMYLKENGDVTSISGVDFDEMTALPIANLRDEGRDLPARFRSTLSTLGLAYTGRYDYIRVTGIDEEW